MTDKNKNRRIIRYVLITVGIIVLSVATGFLLEKVFNVWEHITTLFVFAVFQVSLLTEGYIAFIVDTRIL